MRTTSGRQPPPSSDLAWRIAEAMTPAQRGAAIRLAAGRPLPTDEYVWTPTLLMARAGLEPDPWQAGLLRGEPPRALLLCSRQAGKSSIASAMALQVALLNPDSLVLLLSPTLRQSSELFKAKLSWLYHRLGAPVAAAQETALSLTLANGSRVVSLPGNEEGIRGYSGVSLLVIDEASRVPDSLYYAVRPMLAVSGGRLVALTTPFGKRGWFYEEWERGEGWERVKVRADRCPRIKPEFLAGERLALGERWYRQEYECSFEEVLDSVFAPADIAAALSGVSSAGEEPRPLLGGEGA